MYVATALKVCLPFQLAPLHLGRQRHGADVIATGERLNLILWARSSAFRAAAAFGHVDADGYPREKEEVGHTTVIPNSPCFNKGTGQHHWGSLECCTSMPL
jgi:hypothetical protein